MKYGQSFLRPLLIFLLSVFLFPGCREVFDKQFISEGVIEYEVKYIGNDKENMLAQMIPSTMTCYFKDNKVALDLTGAMGLFKTTYIFDNQNKTFLQLTKMIQKKYATKADSLQAKELNKEYPEMKINITDETKIIAGYECKKAEISFEDTTMTPFEIYFTENLNIKSPNWCTQFNEIKGVLMEYRMRKYNLDLQITAVSVKKETIEENLFALPEGYQMITQKEMDNQFNF